MLLERVARSDGGGSCSWRKRDSREGGLFLKILFKNADITKVNLATWTRYDPCRSALARDENEAMI
jgi:hypothetical protein